MSRYEIKYALFEFNIGGVISHAQMFIAGALLDSLSDEQLERLAPTYAEALLELIDENPKDVEGYLG